MKMNTYWRLNSLCSFPPKKTPKMLSSWILTEKRLSMCVCTHGFFSILLKDKSKILRRLTFELFAFVASVWPLVARWKKSPRRRDLPKLFAIVLSATRQRFNGKVSFPSFFWGGAASHTTANRRNHSQLNPNACCVQWRFWIVWFSSWRKRDRCWKKLAQQATFGVRWFRIKMRTIGSKTAILDFFPKIWWTWLQIWFDVLKRASDLLCWRFEDVCNTKFVGWKWKFVFRVSSKWTWLRLVENCLCHMLQMYSGLWEFWVLASRLIKIVLEYFPPQKRPNCLCFS